MNEREAQVKRICEMWRTSELSAKEIAAIEGTTKGSVSGITHRRGIKRNHLVKIAAAREQSIKVDATRKRRHELLIQQREREYEREKRANEKPLPAPPLAPKVALSQDTNLYFMTLFDLSADNCRDISLIQGVPGGLYCGLPVREGRSYCEIHHARYYQKLPSSKIVARVQGVTRL